MLALYTSMVCIRLYSGKLGICSDRPRHRIDTQFGMVGGLSVVVLSLKFHGNRLPRCEGRNPPYTNTLIGQWLTQQPVRCRQRHRLQMCAHSKGKTSVVECEVISHVKMTNYWARAEHIILYASDI